MPRFVMLPGEANQALANAHQEHVVRRDKDDLVNFVRNIDVPDIGLDVTSVPDVWATLMVFDQALRTRNRAAIGEWRGLLTIFLLRHELRLESRISLLPVFRRDARLNELSSFLKVCRQLLPDELADTSVGWSSLNLILFDDHTIGSTSPLSFVCPAACRSVIHVPGCDWCTGGRFFDPLPFLVGSRLYVLQSWLRKAIDAIASMPDDPRLAIGQPVVAGNRENELNAIDKESTRRLISDFLRDVNLRIADTQIGAPPVVEDSPLEPFAIEGLLQSCLRSRPAIQALPVSTQIQQSAFLLQYEGTTVPATRILLVSEDFIRAFDNGNTEVLAGLSLNQSLAIYDKDQHDQLGPIKLVDAEIYRSNEIFTDKLFYAFGDAFPGTYAMRGVDTLTKTAYGILAPILPLRAAFASHFTPEYLQEHTTFSGSIDRLTVTLDIHLNPAGPSAGQPLRISRTYGKQDMVRAAEVPACSIWPEYSSKDLQGWNNWYTFYDDLSRPEKLEERLLFTPLVDGVLQAQLSDTSLIRDPVDPAKQVLLYQTSDFPTMLLCSMGGAELGILLPKPAARTTARYTEKWRVGIDFGTSGTSVYYTEKDGIDPKILPLDPHLHKVTKLNESYAFFLPTQRENIDGILSVFRDFRGKDEMEGSLRPFHQGHISFVDREQSLGTDSTHGICANMKWGNKQDNDRGKAFLQQLCLITALQARVTGGAGEVEWVFSYPLSFSRARFDEFTTIWNKVTLFAREASGYTVDRGRPALTVCNESECAAMFAHNYLHADLRGGSMILDIGGGSSDIAIWADADRGKQASILDASVKLGGRDLLQRPLLRGRPALLDTLLQSVDKRVKHFGDVADETIAFSTVDALLKRGGETIIELVTEMSRDSGVIAFRELLRLGMRGIFYYAGLLLQHAETIHPERAKHLDGRLPSVYVCGNGGRILHWLNYGKYQPGCILEEQLLEAFAAGAGSRFALETGITQIDLSPLPKAEAAYGMLLAPSTRPAPRQAIPSGESFLLDNSAHPPTDAVPYDEVATIALKVDETLPQFTAFLRSTGYGDLDGRIKRDVTAQVNSTLASLARNRVERKPNGSENEQPIFILVLAQVIRHATAQWKEGGSPLWWVKVEQE